MERLMDFVESHVDVANRPWLLLMPQYVGKKRYFLEYRARLQCSAPPAGRLDAGAENASADSLLFLGPQCVPYSFVAPTVLPSLDAPAPAPDPAPESALGSTLESAPESAPGHGLGLAPTHVSTGSFQCIWFLRVAADAAAAHSVRDKWRQAAEARRPRDDDDEQEEEKEGINSLYWSCVLASDPFALPQLAPGSNDGITPAERRWRKKQRRLQAAEGHSVRQISTQEPTMPQGLIRSQPASDNKSSQCKFDVSRKGTGRKQEPTGKTKHEVRALKRKNL
jgi:hypothetical protein